MGKNGKERDITSYPPRGDGGKWTPTMHAVAEARAECKSWKEAAKAGGVSKNTADHYPSKYPGWDDLVDYYRNLLRSERYNEHFHEGAFEALDALRGEFTHAARQLDELEQVVDDPDVSMEQKIDAAAKSMGLSKAVVAAAKEYLKATGRTKYHETLAKLKAQEEINGEPGERVNLKAKLDDLEDMDAESLANLYRDLRSQES